MDAACPGKPCCPLYTEGTFDEAYNPVLVKMCLNCGAEQCSGSCAAFHQRARALNQPSVPDPYGARGLKFEARGQAHTLPEWSKQLGISREALRERLKRGESLERAIEAIERRKRIAGRTRELTGGTPLKVLARAHGIHENTVRTRLHLGWSLERALNTPADPAKSHRKRR